MDPHVNIGQQSAGNEPVTPPWLKLEGTKESQWYILGYDEQLRDRNTPRGTLNAMFPHNPAVSGILATQCPQPIVYHFCTNPQVKSGERSETG
jgi:hypothetical protein